MLSKLLDMIICPMCKGRPLKLRKTKSRGDEIWTGEIYCRSCERAYPVIEGIPCLLDEAQLEAQNGTIFKEWLQKRKEIEKSIVDEDQKTYKNIYKTAASNEGVDDKIETLMWEKLLYIDKYNVLIEEMGNKASKWEMTKENIKIRNSNIFSFIKQIQGGLKEKLILNVGPGIDDDLVTRLEANGAYVLTSDIIMDPLIYLRNDKKRECLCSDLKSLPFADNVFDTVFCFEVLHHVSPLELALTEAIRVLKPGGKIFVTEPNLHHLIALLGKILPKNIKKLMRKSVRRTTGTNIRIYKPSPYEKVIPSKVLVDAMSKAGFGDIARETAVHSPMCFPDDIINFWDKLGSKFPSIFGPIAFIHMFHGTKLNPNR